MTMQSDNQCNQSVNAINAINAINQSINQSSVNQSISQLINPPNLRVAAIVLVRLPRKQRLELNPAPRRSRLNRHSTIRQLMSIAIRQSIISAGLHTVLSPSAATPGAACQPVMDAPGHLMMVRGCRGTY